MILHPSRLRQDPCAQSESGVLMCGLGVIRSLEHLRMAALHGRRDERVYETYWTTDRGNEAGFWSYGLLDRTVFGRQEPWEDSPEGWPKIPAGQHQWRADGRPLAQWDVTDEPVT